MSENPKDMLAILFEQYSDTLIKSHQAAGLSEEDAEDLVQQLFLKLE